LWESAGPGLGGVFDLVGRAGGHLWARKEGPDGIALEVFLPQADEASTMAAERETR